MQRNRVTILDGGMGRELERMGAPFSQPLWSAQALMEQPDFVKAAHTNFIQAGADVITTNTYALVPPHIGQDLFEARGRGLMAQAARIARDAADEAGDAVQVAGCIPPVFGSYNAEAFDAGTAPALLRPFFEEQAAFVDLWLAETIGSLEEAQVILRLYEELGDGKPFWLAFSLSERFGEDDAPVLRSREALSMVLPVLLDGRVCPDAVLFNCCDIGDVLPAVRISADILGGESAVRIGAYPNAFEKISGKRNALVTSALNDNITPDYYLGRAQSWVEAGATIVGGCCGISPAHIRALADCLGQGEAS